VSRTGPVLFVGLVVASVLTTAVVLHARTPDLALQVTRFPTKISPQGQGPKRVARVARMRFFVRESDADATVQIVGPHVKVVRTLYRGALVANRPVTFIWNGRNGEGTVPNPHHRYRLRVILPGQDRDMVYPRRIALVEASRR
jgi:hypothetical protein